jgi:hypothetical protein
LKKEGRTDEPIDRSNIIGINSKKKEEPTLNLFVRVKEKKHHSPQDGQLQLFKHGYSSIKCGPEAGKKGEGSS